MSKVCIIGVSGFANVHYHDILREQKAGNLECVAACIINQDEEAEKCQTLTTLGCELFTDYQEMLNNYSGKCELCIIPTGIPFHAPMTIATLEAGMHVLLEKPAAGTLEDVDAMIAAEQANPGHVAVAYQSTYTPAIRQVKERLLNGAIGNIEDIIITASSVRTSGYYHRNNWAGRIHNGHWICDAPFANAFSHPLMNALWFAGKDWDSAAQPQHITSELYRCHPIESCDTAIYRTQCENNIRLCFATTHCSEENQPVDIQVRGTQGKLSIKNWDNSLIHIDSKNGIEKFQVEADKERANVYSEVLAMSQNKEHRHCNLHMARVPVLLSNAALASSEIHQIGDAFTTRHTDDEEHVFYHINDIPKRFEETRNNGSLFSEQECLWAKEPGKLDLHNFRGYRSFHEDHSVE